MSRQVFKPRPDQIDFTRARFAPVINCVVMHQDKMLIVKRSAEMNFYPNMWNGVGGFLDDQKSLEEKVHEELSEELGIAAEQIVSIRCGQIFHDTQPQYRKTWIIHPVLVVVTTDRITLDWEAAEYRWIRPDELPNFVIIPSFSKVVENALHH